MPHIDFTVRVTKKADDPICTRVSAGGSPEFGLYCTYRGTKEEAILILKMALAAMEGAAKLLGPGKEPDVAPDDGKQFA